MGLFRGEANRLRAIWRPLVVARYLQAHKFTCLNLGSGPHTHKGWLCADAFCSDADIYLNACSRLPFKDNTFNVVYSEHMLEHIHTDKVPKLLEEIHRILKPGGLFRVTVPDLEIFAAHYVNKNNAFFKPIIDKYSRRRPLSDRNNRKYWLVRSNGGVFNTRTAQRYYRHRFMYDFETLSSGLREVGFVKCIKQEHGKCLNGMVGKMDRPDRAFETLYVDAVK